MQKNLILSLAIIISSVSLYAQEDNEPRYIFGGDGNISVTGFGGPFVGFNGIADKFAVFAGGGGAALFNQQFFFGGYGMGLSTKHYREDLSNITHIENPKIKFGHGGFWLGYIHQYYNAVHFGVSTKLGWGKIFIIDEYYYKEASQIKGADFVFVVNPQLDMELNFTKWLKMNIGLGYQITSGIDKTYIDADGNSFEYYDKADFNHPMGTVTFLFGGFGSK